MERPRSEGRISSSPPRRHLRHAASPHANHQLHRKTSHVSSESCVLFSDSSEQDGEVVASAKVEAKDDGYDRPRRPKTTPKPRIERLLAGPGQVHIQQAQQLARSAASHHSNASSFFMTHLPDSPPRSRKLSASSSDEDGNDLEPRQTIRSLPKERRVKSSENAMSDSISAPMAPSTEERRSTSPTSSIASPSEPRDSAERGDAEPKPSTVASSSEMETPSVFVASAESTSSEDRSDGVDASNGDEEDETMNAENEANVHEGDSPNVIRNEELCAPREANADTVDGPLQVDISLLGGRDISSMPEQPQLDTSDDDAVWESGSAFPVEEDEVVEEKSRDSSMHPAPSLPAAAPRVVDDDDEYTRSLATRTRMQQEERHREQLRHELASYMASLTSRKGEDGTQLVEFPKNYQQVLSLMSQRDVRDEHTTSGTRNASGATPTNTQRSWSHVLLQAGLSKQQAFGILNDEDNGSDGESELAAKIALKMARVRQLDAILEEKLGKNLYAANSSGSNTSKSLAAKKPKSVVVPERNQEPESGIVSSSNRGGTGTGRTFVTQPNSMTKEVIVRHQQSSSSFASSSKKEDSSAAGGPPPLSITSKNSAKGNTNDTNSNNFVERNKKVIACGMKAVLSQDEETRLNRLLRDLGATDSEVTTAIPKMELSPPLAIAVVDPMEYRNGFVMDANDKKQIEELLAAKRGVYHSSLLPPEDDAGDEDDATAEAVASPSLSASCSKKETKTVNIIQATKKERLRKQRLDRIEQEIAFLKENECMSIVADDDADGFEDENNSMFDDTTSERSYRTTTSMATSTCSLRSGVISRRQFNQFLASEKQNFHVNAKKASPDEIRRLVSSLSHLTSRPVA